MKKVYKLQNLDCANCAAKMENALRKLPGITGATVSFMTQRMTLVCEGDPDELMDRVTEVCRRVEPDLQILQ